MPVKGARGGTRTTRTNSVMQLALAERHRKMCESYTSRAKDDGSDKVSFRDKVRAKTGLDIYALGNAGLALAGAVGSTIAAGAGILAAPETGGASLILTGLAAGSTAFAVSDFIEYIHDVNVGKDGEYRHGTENRSYNTMYDGLFNKNDSAYPTVRNIADIGTMIFSIGTTVNSLSKTPAQKIKDVAGKNKVPVLSNSVDDFIKQNVKSDFQQSVKEAFSSDAKVTTLSKDTTVYRYYGDGANPKSYWYTPYKTANPVEDLALPGQNSAQYVKQYVIPKGTTILEGTVSPNFGQPGGGYQYYVPDPNVVK